MSSQAPALKAALVTALRALPSLSGVQITYGEPGKFTADDVLAVMEIESEHVIATLATSRPREETLTLTLVASSVRGGDDPLGDTQKVVTERAYALVGIVEDFVKVTDPTVSDTVRGLTGPISLSLQEGFANAADGITFGRVAEVTATFTFYARW